VAVGRSFLRLGHFLLSWYQPRGLWEGSRRILGVKWEISGEKAPGSGVSRSQGGGASTRRADHSQGSMGEASCQDEGKGDEGGPSVGWRATELGRDQTACLGLLPKRHRVPCDRIAPGVGFTSGRGCVGPKLKLATRATSEGSGRALLGGRGEGTSEPVRGEVGGGRTRNKCCPEDRTDSPRAASVSLASSGAKCDARRGIRRCVHWGERRRGRRWRAEGRCRGCWRKRVGRCRGWLLVVVGGRLG
jgi:hypothetical protein